MQQRLGDALHFGGFENIRRHYINRVADRPNKNLLLQGCSMKPHGKVRCMWLNFKRPDHAQMAEMLNAWVTCNVGQ